MITRRQSFSAAALLLTGCALPLSARAGALAPLRVASVKFGSLGWLLETIQAEGIDKKNGLAMEIVQIANNQTSAIALYGGSADVVVSDWTWALRQRAMGERLKFAPFSTSLGAVMVPSTSPITSLAELSGKRLGVAGSATDKSWLLLRAYSKRTLGKDIADMVVPQYGAAPLLAEQLKEGQIDATLNFWTYCARLEGNGFRRLISMSEVMKALQIEPQPAMVGFVWKEGAAAEASGAIAALLASVGEGNAVLARSDEAWERLRPLLKAASEPEFAALKAGYRAGITGPWSKADMTSAEKIMALLVEGGDTELVGNGTRFDPQLFHSSGT